VIGCIEISVLHFITHLPLEMHVTLMMQKVVLDFNLSNKYKRVLSASLFNGS